MVAQTNALFPWKSLFIKGVTYELPCYFSLLSANFQQFTIELANKGITVLGIGQEPYEQLDEPLRNSLTEYFRVDNLENIDESSDAVAFLFYKHGPIDRIRVP